MTRVTSILAVGAVLLPFLAGDPAGPWMPGAQEAFAQGQGRGQGQDRAAARGGGNDSQGARSTTAARERQPRQQPAQRGQSGGSAAARSQGNAGGQARQAERAGAQRPEAAGRGAAARGQERPERGQAASPPRAPAAAERRSGAGAPEVGSRGGGASGRSAAAVRGRGGRDRAEVRRLVAALPAPARAMASSSRRSERLAAGALALATGRGVEWDAFDLRRNDDRVSILNPRGELLLDLREDRARDLGEWELRRLGDQQPRDSAPAFCRSGEGHPVWGREWCLDKGFGLGGRSDLLWSRGAIDDGYYRWPGDRDRYDRGGLIDVLGDVAMGRLALHALSLGLVDPLMGSFVDEPEGPRLLRIRSGDVEVAEFVDHDRDDRFTVLYVVAPRGY